MHIEVANRKWEELISGGYKVVSKCEVKLNFTNIIAAVDNVDRAEFEGHNMEANDGFSDNLRTVKMKPLG